MVQGTNLCEIRLLVDHKMGVQRNHLIYIKGKKEN